jgi:diguanylate cyclase (GGDEF)-like protein/PAS domain S-box-containing protein
VGAVARRFAVPALLAVVLVAFVAVIVHRAKTDGATADIAATEAAAVGSTAVLLADALRPVVADVGVAVSMVVPHEAARVSELQSAYTVLIAERGVYAAISLLGPDGAELLRVEDGSSGPEVVDRADLVSHAEKTFYTAGITLARNEMFLSALDVEVEAGQNRVIVTPTLRFVSPVMGLDDQLTGLVVVDYRASDLFRSLTAVNGVTGPVTVLGEDGQRLNDLDALSRVEVFGVSEPSFAEDHPEEWAAVSAQPRGHSETDLGMFTWETVDVLAALEAELEDMSGTALRPVAAPGSVGSWTILSVTPAADIAAARSGILGDVLAVAVPVGGVLLAAVGAFVLGQVRRDAAAQHRALAELVIDATSEGVAITDPGGRVVDVNQAYLDISGHRRSDVLGALPRFLDVAGQAFDFSVIGEGIHRHGRWHGDLWMRDLRGALRPVAVVASAVEGRGGRVERYVGVVSDIAERQEREQRLRDDASTDGLTGLTNHDGLVRAMAEVANRPDADDIEVAALFCDLDGFKYVNDEFGHAVGDELLIAVSRRIENTIRDADVAARFGGDEFVVLLVDVEDLATAERTARRIVERLSEPIVVSAGEVRVSASVSVAICRGSQVRPTILLERSDEAMYAAKRAGRNTWRTFGVPDGQVPGAS